MEPTTINQVASASGVGPEIERAIKAMAEAQRHIKAAYARAACNRDAIRAPLLERVSAELNEAQLTIKRAL